MSNGYKAWKGGVTEFAPFLTEDGYNSKSGDLLGCFMSNSSGVEW